MRVSDMDRFHDAPLIDPIVSWVGHRTSKEECIKELGDARIPSNVVNTVSDALADAQVTARNMIEYLFYPALAKLPVPGVIAGQELGQQRHFPCGVDPSATHTLLR